MILDQKNILLPKSQCLKFPALFRLIQFFLVASFFFGLPGLGISDLNAQQTSDTLTIELPEVNVSAIQTNVSATDAPLALSISTRDLQTIHSSSGLSLTDLGNQLPGLWINDRQNYALGERITIRGVGWRSAFGVRGIQVVLDGIPLTVADGQSMINVIDPSFVRRIELVRGPAASFWGNSSGGVLYLSTIPHQLTNTGLRIRAEGGSFGMRKAEAEFSLDQPGHQVAMYSSYLMTNGYRDYSQARVLRSGLTGKVKLTSKSRLKYQAGAIYMPEAQHPSSLTKQQSEDNPTMAISSFVNSGAGKTINQEQAGFSYQLDTSQGLLTISGYGIYRDLENPLPFGIITLNRWAGGLRSTFDKSWNHFDLQIGAETKLQRDDRTEFDNIGSPERGDIQVDQIEKVSNQALFATGTYRTGKLRLLGGLRFDHLRFKSDAPTANQSGQRSFEALSPSIGVMYNLQDQSIFANLTTSFEAPTTTELVNRPGGGNGFNPALQPEHTLGLEFGSRGTINSGTIHYDLALYRLWIRDLLLPYQLETDGPVYYRNQGKTTHSGIEGRFSWAIDHDWNISATANLIHAEFQKAQTLNGETLSGNDVPGIPNYRLNGQLKWTPGSFVGILSYEYVSDYAVNDQNTAHNNSYHIIDLKASYNKLFTHANFHIQPFINLNNVFDSRYNGSVVVNSSGGRYYEPAPGRNVQMGISVRF